MIDQTQNRSLFSLPKKECKNYYLALIQDYQSYFKTRFGESSATALTSIK